MIEEQNIGWEYYTFKLWGKIRIRKTKLRVHILLIKLERNLKSLIIWAFHITPHTYLIHFRPWNVTFPECIGWLISVGTPFHSYLPLSSWCLMCVSDENWEEAHLSQDTDTLDNRKTVVLIYLKHLSCIYLGFIGNIVILNQYSSNTDLKELFSRPACSDWASNYLIPH